MEFNPSVTERFISFGLHCQEQQEIQGVLVTEAFRENSLIKLLTRRAVKLNFRSPTNVMVCSLQLNGIFTCYVGT